MVARSEQPATLKTYRHRSWSYPWLHQALFSSSKPGFLFHKIKIHKQIQIRKRGSEFPGNFSSRWGIDENALFDNLLFLSVLMRCMVNAYLTGAPRLWAGFSSTVTVLSVWFREVSWSYAGMEGAEEQERRFNIWVWPLHWIKSKYTNSRASHGVYIPVKTSKTNPVFIKYNQLKLKAWFIWADLQFYSVHCHQNSHENH